jgi:hypothetical protein
MCRELVSACCLQDFQSGHSMLCDSHDVLCSQHPLWPATCYHDSYLSLIAVFAPRWYIGLCCGSCCLPVLKWYFQCKRATSLLVADMNQARSGDTLLHMHTVLLYPSLTVIPVTNGYGCQMARSGHRSSRSS